MAVHGIGGATGTLLVALLATVELGGSGLSEGATVISQFGVQALGVVVTTLWSILATLIIIQIVKATCGLRVTNDEETEGLDYIQHGEVGYRN